MAILYLSQSEKTLASDLGNILHIIWRASFLPTECLKLTASPSEHVLETVVLLFVEKKKKEGGEHLKMRDIVGEVWKFAVKRQQIRVGGRNISSLFEVPVCF